MKQGVKVMLKSILLLMGLIIIATGIMIAVYALPTQKMFFHAKESISILNEGKGQDSEWAPGIASSQTSYATDAIMINNSIYDVKKGLIIKTAMLNPRYEDGQGNVLNSLYKTLQYDSAESIEPKLEAITPTDSFQDVNNTTGELETMYYPRYWHGYLAFLKPLLLFFNIAEIKMISMIIQTLLSAVVICLILKKLGAGIVLAFATMVALINPITTVLTFQETDIYVITLCSLVVILSLDKVLMTRSYYIYFFLVIGALTCFFDFLTYPLVSLGVPLATYILLHNGNVRQTLKSVFKYSIAWGGGYAGLWLGKFVVCSVLTDYNALKIGMQSVLFRVGAGTLNADNYETSVMGAIRSNIDCMCNWPTAIMLLVLAVTIVILLLKGYRYTLINSNFVGLLVVAFFPVAWTVVMSNHSFFHPYMTYRVFAVSWFCLSSVLLYRWKRV